MKLEIEVGEELLHMAAAEIAARLFARPDGYSSKGGQGYQAMAAQTETWLGRQDFSAVIQAEVERQLQSVLSEVVRAKLQAEVKRQASELAKQLRLVPGGSDAA